MRNKPFRNSAIVRKIRWLLVKNGLSEDDADAAIEKLHADLVANKTNEDDRLLRLQTFAYNVTKIRLKDDTTDLFKARYNQNYLLLLAVVGAAGYDALKFAVTRAAEYLEPAKTDPVPRAEAPIPPKPYLKDPNDDLKVRGSVFARVVHPDIDWSTNNRSYSFDMPRSGPISWRATKHSNKTLTVWIVGPSDRKYDFSIPMPRCRDAALNIGITWGDGNVRLYLNGKLSNRLRMV
jgi:hypothetical protein